jgi:hypothetical protein
MYALAHARPHAPCYTIRDSTIIGVNHEVEEEIDEALRFALSQDVTATTAGDIRLAAMMIDSTEGFALTNEEEQRAFVSKVTLYKPLFRADFIH